MLLRLLFTGGALKGHFGLVHLENSPLSTVVKLLCLQHVTVTLCYQIKWCEVNFIVRCYYDSCL